MSVARVPSFRELIGTDMMVQAAVLVVVVVVVVVTRRAVCARARALLGCQDELGRGRGSVGGEDLGSIPMAAKPQK